MLKILTSHLSKSLKFLYIHAIGICGVKKWKVWKKNVYTYSKRIFIIKTHESELTSITYKKGQFLVDFERNWSSTPHICPYLTVYKNHQGTTWEHCEKEKGVQKRWSVISYWIKRNFWNFFEKNFVKKSFLSFHNVIVKYFCILEYSQWFMIFL